MFTGIVEEVGTLRSLREGPRSAELDIAAHTVLDGLRVGDSMRTDGVCLTVTRSGADGFCADVEPETVRRTTLAERRPGDRLNLERALAARRAPRRPPRQGHVDGVGTVGASARGQRPRRRPHGAAGRDAVSVSPRARSPSTA